MSQVLSEGDAAEPRSFGFGRILVTDGDFADRYALVHGVAEDGFDVVAAETAEDTRGKFDRARPHLVMVASDLADGGAAPLCAWIRARSAVPIMVIHRKTSTVDPVLLLEMGADRVVRVPVSGYELTARVRALLRRIPRAIDTDETVTFSSLQLDTGRWTLSVGETSVALDGRDYALMELLMTSGTKVISRTRLQAELRVSSSELDGCVRRLREQLEPIEGWRRIVSQRGVGFRLLERPVLVAHGSVGAATPSLLPA